jgi:hypothetical protein
MQRIAGGAARNHAGAARNQAAAAAPNEDHAAPDAANGAVPAGQGMFQTKVSIYGDMVRLLMHPPPLLFECECLVVVLIILS